MAQSKDAIFFMFCFFEFLLVTYVSSSENYYYVQEEGNSLGKRWSLRHVRDITDDESSRTSTYKPKVTKKPLGLDSKQAAILAGASSKFNKTVTNKSNYSEPNGTTTAANHEWTTTARPWMKASGPVMLNMTLPPDTEIQISKFVDDFNQSVLQQHNVTSKQEDYHTYYNSSIMVGEEKVALYWVDMEKHQNVKVSDILSNSHRRAVTVKLSFDFPFYGHIIRNITIATGGFLYTGDYVHSWLAATQYIAPLMANFDTTKSEKSFVMYLDNGTAFTVEWENVTLQHNQQNGSFTFQCTLFDTGDIVFVYRKIGMSVQDIEDTSHPVKVGLSDAYIIDRTIFFVRRKTIYEYHRVEFKGHDISNSTVILLYALDTCVAQTQCDSCKDLNRAGLQCSWCGGRCSNGMDRHRHDWLNRGCDRAAAMEECDSSGSSRRRTSAEMLPGVLEGMDQMGDNSVDRAMTVPDGGDHLSSILGTMIALIVFTAVSVWLLYAYTHPHSSSGQLLIRYRPSQWTWRRGEARYTAATIHM